MTDPQRVMPDPEAEPTLTIEHAGEILGLGRASSYAAARRGEIPTIPFGRRRVVPTAMLRAMLGLDADRGEGHAA